MKKSLATFISGFLSATIILSGTLVYAESSKTIEAIFGKIKLIVNGNTVDKETLLYNGTTYVPLRAVSEALYKDVKYDEKTSTVTISDKVAVDPLAKPAPTQTAPTPTEPTNKSNIKMYNDFKEVPDLGAFFGLDPIDSIGTVTKDALTELGGTLYSIDFNRLWRYTDLLKSQGFTQKTEIPDDRGQKYSLNADIYANNNYIVTLYTHGNSNFVIVTVKTNYKYATNESVKMYKKYPSIPDFGAIMEVEPNVSSIDFEGKSMSDMNAISYKVDINRIWKYGDILKSNGFKERKDLDNDFEFGTAWVPHNYSNDEYRVSLYTNSQTNYVVLIIKYMGNN